ncbi:MAG: sugar phosphate isomerase/epimerase family protein [Acidobacteriota bacterium]
MDTTQEPPEEWHMAQIGVNAWVWSSPVNLEEFSRLAPHVARMGFDLIEVGIEGIHDLDYARAAEVATANGLAVSVCAAMGPDRDLIHDDESVRANGLAYLHHCIKATRTIGATNLVGPMYSAVGRTWQQTEEERQRDLDRLVPQLRELAAAAGEEGVVLCLEPLNRFETSFINLTSQAIEVADRVDHPAFGLLLDTFHMNIEERALGDAIRSAGTRLRHLHTCENDRGAPGTGHVPWTEVAEACRAIGFEGPMVIESFTQKVKSIARAAAIWRPLAETQDALAIDGLTFLRALTA